MGVDKYKAVYRKWRIKEATLLLLSLIGGGLGGFFGMSVFKHKTKKFYFSLTFALSIIIHICLFCYFIKIF